MALNLTAGKQLAAVSLPLHMPHDISVSPVDTECAELATVWL
jgi:hypothetical protein